MPLILWQDYIYMFLFCSSKCSYCAFYSVTNNQLKQDYIEAVCKELYLRKHFFQDIHLKNNQFDPIVNTVYFGGGTPSCLSESDFERSSMLFMIVLAVLSKKLQSNVIPMT